MEFAEPVLTVTEARAVLDEAVTALSVTGPQFTSRLPAAEELHLNWLPDPASMATSVVRGEPEPCLDGANRDTGSEWRWWGYLHPVSERERDRGPSRAATAER